MHSLVTIFSVALGLFGLTGCERAQTTFDLEVDRLCSIDGGVHIYEKVILPKENFDENGKVTSKFKQIIGSQSDVAGLYRSHTERQRISEKKQISFIQTGLSLSRARLYVVRVADGKVLGERIRYVRGGGDFFGPWEGSSYSCPHLPSDPADEIFIPGE